MLHVELDVKGSGLAAAPGDALGLLPLNCPELVSQLLLRLGADGDAAFELTATGSGTTGERVAGLTMVDHGGPRHVLALRHVCVGCASVCMCMMQGARSP